MSTPTTRVHFGKYQGKLLADVPQNYVEWVAANFDDGPNRDLMARELDRRAEEIKSVTYANPLVTPTEDQQAALSRIATWLEFGGGTSFKFGGLAGTGKSTVIGFAIDLAHAAGLDVKIGTPTGRAASVVNSKLPKPIAKTIHSLAYALKGNRLSGRKDHKGRPISEPEFGHKAEFKAGLMIIDEASMVTEEMFQYLSERCSYLLFVGDHGQLPPVGDPDISPAMRQLDYELTDIQRQVADSPIIKLSRIVREGHPLASYGLIPEYRMQNMDHAVKLTADADMVITAHNETRHAFNEASRLARGYAAALMPQKDEPMLVTSNSFKSQLFNGETWTTVECEPVAIDDFEEGPIYEITLDNGLEDEYQRTVTTLLGHDWRTDKVMDLMQAANVKYDPNNVSDRATEMHDILQGDVDLWEKITKYGFVGANWGYALTGHKSQGSQAKHVAIINEGPVGHPRFHRNWTYTAATRASDQLTLIQP